MDLAHPLAVALGEVVVDGDDVHALAGEGVEVGGQHGDEGLALAGLHLGDAALVEHDAADELHAEGLHAQHAPCRLAHDGEGLGQELVEVLTGLIAGLEFVGLGAQLLVGERLHLRLKGLDFIRDRIDPLQLVVTVGAEELL